MPNKMTDNEIIKALECFAIDKDFDETHCIGCAFEHQFCTANMSNDIAKMTLDLINRLQDENNHLKETNEELKVTTGLMQRRKYYKKFVEEVFQKERNNNLIYPDFDDVYRRYFEQKAEIEQWKEEANRYQNLWCKAVKDIETAKAEAAKEVAERAKALFPSDSEPYQYWEIHDGVDNILKEMVGENDANT